MGDQRAFAEEVHELVGNIGKRGFVLQVFDGNAMHPLGVGVNVPVAGMDVAMEVLAGGNAVDQFHRADLDDAVTLSGRQTRRFRIEDDFAEFLSHSSTSFPTGFG